MWSSEPPCLVELVGIDDVVDNLIYTATNPVNDGLVERVHQWPGPKTVRALLTGQTLKARQPWFLFRDDGPMPEEVEATVGAVGSRTQIVERRVPRVQAPVGGEPESRRELEIPIAWPVRQYT